MVEALARCGASVVASFVLAGGVLSGKYAADPQAGRAAGTLHQPRVARAVAAAREVATIATSIDADAATLAMAFALANPSVATVLFGATRPEQVRANVAALDLLPRLDAGVRARLAALATTDR